MVWHQYNGHGSIFVLEDYPPYRKEVVRYLDLVGSTYSGHTLFKYCNILVDESRSFLLYQHLATRLMQRRIIIQMMPSPMVSRCAMVKELSCLVPEGPGSKVSDSRTDSKSSKRRHRTPPDQPVTQIPA